ncbi:GNAT family N-acetyltransferase [Pyxidicoccus sp. 3LFB2]
MSTPEVRLIPARPAHVDYWMVLRSESAARRYVDTEEDSREQLLHRIFEAGTPGDTRAKGFRWFVEYDGRLIGTVSARDVSRGHGRAQLGYMMSEAYHGQGLGTRAVAMMLEQLFTPLPFLQRVWLTTLAENAASQGVARKLGFTLEGTMRGHCMHLGQRRDQQLWGLLRSEWEARRHG